MIRLVKVDTELYDLCKAYNVHHELMFNKKGRPCVLLVKLRYKGVLQDFVVPLRSNISPTTPKSQYLSLPPNKHTKNNHKHGVHYIKLFPIQKQYIKPYRIKNDKYYSSIVGILENHEKEIIHKCQTYLQKYEQGEYHTMTPDIDGILSVLNNCSQSYVEAAVTSETEHLKHLQAIISW